MAKGAEQKIPLDAVPRKRKYKKNGKKYWSRQAKPEVNVKLLADLLVEVAKRL